MYPLQSLGIGAREEEREVYQMPGAGVRKVEFKFGDVLRTDTSHVEDARLIYVRSKGDVFYGVVLRPSAFHGWTGIEIGAPISLTLRGTFGGWYKDETWPS